MRIFLGDLLSISILHQNVIDLIYIFKEVVFQQEWAELSKILKNYFILCVSIKNFKYLATKIEVPPLTQMFELVQ